jgi:hypothetical protein
LKCLYMVKYPNVQSKEDADKCNINLKEHKYSVLYRTLL